MCSLRLLLAHSMSIMKDIINKSYSTKTIATYQVGFELFRIFKFISI